VLPNFTHECVLKLLKLSSNVNECKPLPLGSKYAVKALDVGSGLASRNTASKQGLTLVHF